MKKRYSVTVALVNLDNGFDIDFNSYNDAIHFAHAIAKSPDFYSFDIWELVDTHHQERWVLKYSKTNGLETVLGF